MRAIMFSRLPRPAERVKIPVRSLGLSTGYVVYVERVKPKQPKRIEVQYVRS